ncbi:uncharacterized protein EDB91DRAFT_1124822 [Suillus paluster]|uniref:uncharacterized protein n=1 Tax=Suillus paluster TaxID=48578 RepID=UPI001B880BCB|nr:uncharacterized protein EDB91DRAFT_1124822 [Suillus paluster]KAG1744163.1 hypothetical protein EDB91DRAFT_1124822 [Suillus paluster]
MLSIDLAALIGFGCEAVLYGCYCVLFVISWVVLGRKRPSLNISNPVVFANCLLFLCCTAHFALQFNHFYTTLESTGVIGFSTETPGLTGADFLISFTDLVGDLVLVYRCWMLWGKNYYVVILPLLSAFGGFACIMEVLHLVITTNPTSPAPPASIVPLGLAGYIMPLATNVIVTTLIVYRIWFSSRIVRESPVHIGQSASRHAMMLIIESGALYLVTQFVFVVLFAISHPAEGIMAVIATQVYVSRTQIWTLSNFRSLIPHRASHLPSLLFGLVWEFHQSIPPRQSRPLVSNGSRAVGMTQALRVLSSLLIVA